MRPHGQQQALARRRQEQEQLALDRSAPRVLVDGPCPVCDDHDGWWLDDENPPVWEPCWAHEPLPDTTRKERPPCPR